MDNYILKGCWALAFKALPPNVPANLVSIVGNVGSWLAFALLSGIPFGPAALCQRPRAWIFLVAAFCVAFYQTLDALDGMQARRNRASGPLGEFVDHWFDSFNAFLLPLGIILAFPSVSSSYALLLVFLFVAADFLTLEEVRQTGVLVFDPFSVEEAVFLEVLLLASIGLVGYDFWNAPLLLGLSPIRLLLGFFGIALLGVCVRSLAKTRCFRRLAVETLCLAPIAAWTLLSEPATGRQALLYGCLLLGFTASRFSGDLLRERLLGLEYPEFPRDILAVDALLLVSLLLADRVPGAPALAGWLALTWTMLELVAQFTKAVSRVEETLGIGLFGPVEGPREAPVLLAKARQGVERSRQAIRGLINK